MCCTKLFQLHWLYNKTVSEDHVWQVKIGKDLEGSSHGLTGGTFRAIYYKSQLWTSVFSYLVYLLNTRLDGPQR
jgi:hypothetical protein